MMLMVLSDISCQRITLGKALFTRPQNPNRYFNSYQKYKSCHYIKVL